MKSNNCNIYVIGVFDLFHKGHLELLRRARSLGDKLIVAINSDDMVSQYKRRPFIEEENRLAVIKSCRYVDEAFIIDDFDNKEPLIKYDIDVIVHGDDWDRGSYLKQLRITEEFLKEHDIALSLLPYTEGISTSQIIEKIKADN